MSTPLATSGAMTRADGGYFAGYASVFGRIDKGRDIVVKGAFARSIAERGPRGIKVLWQHDPREPIGVLEEIREDDYGLFVRARLLHDVRRASEARALLQAAAVDGLSIGYKTVAADTDDRTGVRQLRDVDLWEVSLVTFPMQEAARVVQFKSAAGWSDVVRALRQFEWGMSELATRARHRLGTTPHFKVTDTRRFI